MKIQSVSTVEGVGVQVVCQFQESNGPNGKIPADHPRWRNIAKIIQRDLKLSPELIYEGADAKQWIGGLLEVQFSFRQPV